MDKNLTIKKLEMSQLKKIILKSNFILFFLKYLYYLINKIIIKKDKIYYVHYLQNKTFINFHPVLKIKNFYNSFEIFTKNFKPKKKQIIVDVGAGLGNEMLLFSKAIGFHGKIFCIEPDPRLFKVLKKLIFLNKLNNVSLYNKSFYKKNNIQIKIYLDKIDNWMANSNQKTNHKNQYIYSNTITIDKIIKDKNLKHIDFAKFNIEGAEKYLDQGNSKFLKICKNIVISCHDFLKKKETRTFKKITYLLKKNKFKIIDNESNDNILKYFIYAKK